MTGNRFGRLLLRTSVSILALVALVNGVHAQETGSARSPKPREITGVIVDESGKPIPTMDVIIGRFDYTGHFVVATDEEGRFRSGALDDGLFYVWANGLGMIEPQTARRNRPYHRPGDRVTIRLARGGVITGKVTDATGKPMIAIRITAQRVKGTEAGDEPEDLDHTGEATTDDRGVYRIYGLQPGSYLVSAGRARRSWEPPSLRDKFAPVYYPSGGVDTASEVKVQLGAETTNIDVTFRAVEGHRISGQIVGSYANKDNYAQVSLRDKSNRVVAWTTASGSGGTGLKFEFSGIADGVYDVVGDAWVDDSRMRSTPRRVNLHGADVSNVELVLVKSASLQGKLQWEDGETLESCKRPVDRRERETFVKLIPAVERPGARDRQRIAPMQSADEFLAKEVEEGAHWLELDPPDRHWYVARIEREAAAGAKPAQIAGRPIRVDQSEQVRGILVTLRGGAAAVKGRVLSPDGAPVARGTRVVLVPAEETADDDALRYYEVEVGGDGAYLLDHLAPGQYRAIVLAPDEKRPAAAPPAAWDQARRTMFRKKAASAGVALMLLPCQRVDALDLLAR